MSHCFPLVVKKLTNLDSDMKLNTKPKILKFGLLKISGFFKPKNLGFFETIFQPWNNINQSINTLNRNKSKTNNNTRYKK